MGVVRTWMVDIQATADSERLATTRPAADPENPPRPSVLDSFRLHRQPLVPVSGAAATGTTGSRRVA